MQDFSVATKQGHSSQSTSGVILCWDAKAVLTWLYLHPAEKQYLPHSLEEIEREKGKRVNFISIELLAT